MIQILDKQNCCGCSSCAQRCRNQCISMQVDPEGFLYPHVNSEICIDCGYCEKVCPMITPFAEQQPMKTLAVVNRNNNTREQSSSGGAFSLIAEKIKSDKLLIVSSGLAANTVFVIRHITTAIIISTIFDFFKILVAFSMLLFFFITKLPP